MDNNKKALFGKKQMTVMQRLLKELEKGNTRVFRKDGSIVLPYDIYFYK